MANRIVNPIYGSVFKSLMEDERVARNRNRLEDLDMKVAVVHFCGDCQVLSVGEKLLERLVSW